MITLQLNMFNAHTIKLMKNKMSTQYGRFKNRIYLYST